MKFNILEYLGKIKDGVLVLITLEYDNKYYDSTFYYNKEMITITINDDLIVALGCDIEEYQSYDKLCLDILKEVIPYDEIITRLDDIEIDNL